MRSRIGYHDDNRAEWGFTMVELLIVVVILGILAGIAVFSIANLSSTSQNTACAASRRTYETAVEAFRVKYSRIPAETGPNSLLSPPNGDARLITSASPDFNVDGTGTVTSETAANGGKCEGH